MSGLVRVLFLLFVGLALGVSYNAWPIAANSQFINDGSGNLQTVDIMSYAAGLLVGMGLWQIGNIPWAALPAHLHAYLASQIQFYQFIVMGAACIAVLVYF